MIKEYKDDYFYLSQKHFSRFTILDNSFSTIAQAYKFFEKENTKTNWEELNLHFLYKITLAKFEQNKLFKDKLIKLDSDKLDTDTDYGNILHLVQVALRSTKAIEENMKEQESLPEWEVLEEIFTPTDTGD